MENGQWDKDIETINQELTLNTDHSYTLKEYSGSDIYTSSGTWSFNGNTLSRTNNGNSLEFTVLELTGNKLTSRDKSYTDEYEIFYFTKQ